MNRNDDGKTKRNNKWQLWIAVATTAIAAVGAIATWAYNEQQSRFREIETVEKFFPHLVSTDRRLSNMAKLTVKNLLSDPELADRLIQAAVEVTSDDAATKPELTSKELGERRAARAPTATIEGWAYLGNYIDGNWQTRYFDFSANADPQQFVTHTLRVREVTGALNLRLNMPTPEGTFPPVIDVLEPGTEVRLLEVQRWQSSSYMWGRVAITKK